MKKGYVVRIVLTLFLLSVFFVGFEKIFESTKVVSVSTECKLEEVNGPAIIAPSRPVVTITQEREIENQWISVSGYSGQFVFTYSPLAMIGEKHFLDGRVENMSDGRIMILNPGNYTLQVITHPRPDANSYPQLLEEDVVQTTTFLVKECN